MYKRRLALWKLDGKYLKKSQVRQIARLKVGRDAVGKRSRFSIKGQEVRIDNVQRYLRNNGFSSFEDMVQATSPGSLDDDIACYTPGRSPMSSGTAGSEGSQELISFSRRRDPNGNYNDDRSLGQLQVVTIPTPHMRNLSNMISACQYRQNSGLETCRPSRGSRIHQHLLQACYYPSGCSSCSGPISKPTLMPGYGLRVQKGFLRA